MPESSAGHEFTHCFISTDLMVPNKCGAHADVMQKSRKPRKHLKDFAAAHVLLVMAAETSSIAHAAVQDWKPRCQGTQDHDATQQPVCLIRQLLILSTSMKHNH